MTITSSYTSHNPFHGYKFLIIPILEKLAKLISWKLEWCDWIWKKNMKNDWSLIRGDQLLARTRFRFSDGPSWAIFFSSNCNDQRKQRNGRDEFTDAQGFVAVLADRAKHIAGVVHETESARRWTSLSILQCCHSCRGAEIDRLFVSRSMEQLDECHTDFFIQPILPSHAANHDLAHLPLSTEGSV